jgi:hypothetical protein
MQYIRKIFHISLLSIFCIFSFKNSFAQYPGMGAFRAQQSRQFANQQIQQQMNMNMMMMNMRARWASGAGRRTTYQVTFKDNSVKEVISLMYTDTVLHKNYILFVDKTIPKSDSVHRNQKIYSDQTRYISTIIDYEAKTETYGVATDSCWMFKVISGPINLYAKSLDYLIPTNDGDSSELNLYAIVGIQLNDGPIVALTDYSLKQMVGPDAAALKSAEKKNYYSALKKYNRHFEKRD